MEIYFECRSCDSKFPTGNKLKVHVMKNHDTGKVCPQCKVKSKNIRALKKHMKDKCKGNTSNHVPQINDESTKETVEAPNVSGNNAKKVKRDAVVKMNISKKKTEPRFKCRECHKTYETTDGLRKHKQTHTKYQAINKNIMPVSFIIDNSGTVEVDQGAFETVEIEYVEA